MNFTTCCHALCCTCCIPHCNIFFEMKFKQTEQPKKQKFQKESWLIFLTIISPSRYEAKYISHIYEVIYQRVQVESRCVMRENHSCWVDHISMCRPLPPRAAGKRKLFILPSKKKWKLWHHDWQQKHILLTFIHWMLLFYGHQMRNLKKYLFFSM